MTMKRRDALKTLGALAGAASTARMLAACDDEIRTGRIDTFVFLMMENRSYDHYLGCRSLLEGKPGDGLVAGMFNRDLAGNPVPIFTPSGDAVCALDPPHTWEASRIQLGGSQNDGFVVTHQERHGSTTAIDPMQYMTREQIPVIHALADAYTSCDRWFSSVLGPTLPNRMYWHAGTSNGARNNGEVLAGAFRGVPSLYHRLDEAGVDWAYYFADVPVLAFFDNLELEGRLRRFMWQFIDDAAAGRLPPVVYIDPGFTWNDDHPPHHPMLGQQLLAATYQALATSPQWSRCLLVITYDENGGFFDHVAPPTTTDDRAADGFDQLGFRVPALVVGPYAKQGHVTSVVHDHTSPLRHLEKEFGLAPLTARSGAANDLWDAIDRDRLAAGKPADPIALPAIEFDLAALPDRCRSGTDIVVPGSGLATAGAFGPPYDHDIVAWADQVDLGKWDLRREIAEYGQGIAGYLAAQGPGRRR